MSNVNVIRAWKDPEYRNSLSPSALARIPNHPSGVVELSERQLKDAAFAGPVLTTAITCTEFTFLGWRACCP